MSTSPRLSAAAALFTRWAVALGYLSAVADRLGLWGPPGAPRVIWGTWQPFVAYTAKLNPYASPAIAQFLAVAATLAEVLLAIALLVGWRLRATALASAALASSFVLAMTLSLGPKAPLDYSVLAVVAASLLLAFHPSASTPPRGDPSDASAARAGSCPTRAPGVSINQLHTPLLDATPPRWRCLARPALGLLVALLALWCVDRV